MKKQIAIALTLFAVAGCAPPKPPVRPATGRASLVHLGMAIRATAEQCRAHARWLARGEEKFDFSASERANELAEACTKALIPAKDAVYFTINDKGLEDWTPAAQEKAACAGLATYTALSTLYDVFRANNVWTPSLMLDGIVVGRELGASATRACDPIHPTTTVTVYRR